MGWLTRYHDISVSRGTKQKKQNQKSQETSVYENWINYSDEWCAANKNLTNHVLNKLNFTRKEFETGYWSSKRWCFILLQIDWKILVVSHIDCPKWKDSFSAKYFSTMFLRFIMTVNWKFYYHHFGMIFNKDPYTRHKIMAIFTGQCLARMWSCSNIQILALTFILSGLVKFRFSCQIERKRKIILVLFSHSFERLSTCNIHYKKSCCWQVDKASERLHLSKVIAFQLLITI